MIESLVMHYCDGNKAKFAKMLGIQPQTINGWIVRNTFDPELIYSKCEGVSGDWLLSGEGDMIKPSGLSSVHSQSHDSEGSRSISVDNLNEIVEKLDRIADILTTKLN